MGFSRSSVGRSAKERAKQPPSNTVIEYLSGEDGKKADDAERGAFHKHQQRNLKKKKMKKRRRLNK